MFDFAGQRRSELTNNDHGVVDEPVLSAPWGVAGVAVAGDDHDHPDQAKVRGVWLEVSEVREGASVDSLCLACVVEEDERSAHNDVGDHTSGGHKVDQPVKHLLGSAANLQERQAGEDHGDCESEHRDTALRAL